MKTRIRKLAGDRRDQLLTKAAALAARTGYMSVSRAAIAAACDVSEALISHHFGTMAQFRRALMRHAVDTENLAVIAQGIVARDKQALKAPDNLRARALAGLGA